MSPDPPGPAGPSGAPDPPGPATTVPLVRRPGRWDVPPQHGWRRPGLRSLLGGLLVAAPVPPAAVLLAGDPEVGWTTSAVLAVNVLLDACREPSPPGPGEVPELVGPDRDLVRAAVARGRLPDRADLAGVSLRYAATRSAVLRRTGRRLGLLVPGWLLLVGLLDLVLLARWPASAGVRHPAALVSAGAALAVGALLLVVLAHRGRRVRRVLRRRPPRGPQAGPAPR